MLFVLHLSRKSNCHVQLCKFTQIQKSTPFEANLINNKMIILNFVVATKPSMRNIKVLCKVILYSYIWKNPLMHFNVLIFFPLDIMILAISITTKSCAERYLYILLFFQIKYALKYSIVVLVVFIKKMLIS